MLQAIHKAPFFVFSAEVDAAHSREVILQTFFLANAGVGFGDGLWCACHCADKGNRTCVRDGSEPHGAQASLLENFPDNKGRFRETAG